MKLGAAIVLAACLAIAQVPLDTPTAVVNVSSEAIEALPGRTDFSKLALLVAADRPGGSASKPLGDQVRVELSDGLRGTASVSPPGWSVRMDGKTMIAQGPPVESITIRYDAGKDLEKLIGKTCRIRISLNGKEVLNQQLMVQLKNNPAVGSITFPPIVTYGRPFWGSRDGSFAPVQGLDLLPSAAGERNSFPRPAFRHWDDQEFIFDFSPVVDRIRPVTAPTNAAGVVSGFTLVGRDRFDDKVFESSMNMQFMPEQQCTPGITGGDRFVFAGQNACVTGCFNGLEADAKALAALLDDKTELQPKAGSPNAFVVRIPPDTKPGPYEISLARLFKARYPITVLSVEGSIDQNELWKGQSTTMRLRVLGTEERLPLEITNKTPGTIRIGEGVTREVVNSPGGADNAITRSVTGIRKGNFNIEYKLNLPACGVVPPR